MELSDRKRLILRAIVDDYIHTAEPVGSSYILNKYNLGISSATIRNEMAYLEEHGYLDKPHTSAGRVPSSLGYRVYVDELMQRYTLTVNEINELKNSLKKQYMELGNVVSDISSTISHLTNYTTIISTPVIKSSRLKNIKFVVIDEHNLVMILVSSDGLVKNTMLHIKEKLNTSVVEKLGNFLNIAFCEKPFVEITEEFLITQRELIPVDDSLINPIFEFILMCAKSFVDFDILKSGESNILNFPEFKNIERTKEFFDFIKNMDKTILSSSALSGDVKVLIGDENPHLEKLGLSMVVSDYTLKDGAKGGIAIIGPTRMDYSKVVATLDYIKNNLNKFLP